MGFSIAGFSSIREWVQSATEKLNSVGLNASKLEAQMLVAHALGVDRTFVITHGDDLFETRLVDELLTRRSGHEPLAYILGWREFYGRRFRVDRSVLIPRHETEVLVDETMALGGDCSSGCRLLDVGTGSGCIGITLKLERPNWDVWAVDISCSAIQTARENAETLGADVCLRHSDLFDQLGGMKFDMIVSNPPYIGKDESLPKEVREFEPEAALFADDGGLAIYRRIADEYRTFLNPGGWLLLEIGQTQGEALLSLFSGSRLVADLDGNPRVLVVPRDMPK